MSLEGVVSHAHLANLSGLERLDLSNNPLKLNITSDWLPPFQLNELLLKSCKIGEIPQWIETQNELVILDLSGNFMRGQMPRSFGECNKLEYLDLSHNMLTGKIPKLLGKCNNLEYLDLSSNLLEGVDSGYHFANLSSLQVLYLSSNHFKGGILESFGWCKKLLKIDLSSNLLESLVSNSRIANLSSLQNLDLSGNHLGGQIPEFLGQLNKLEYLNLSHNQLTGKIPELLGKCNSLKSLDLSSNLLEGVVSNYHFANLSSLDTLHLSDNPLSFNFSPKWIPPFQLSEFVMRSCGIQGELPQWIQTQSSVWNLDLSNNMITGKMLDWSRNVNLLLLNLSHNHIVGLITHFPPEISSIDLSHNFLSGPLSQDLPASKDKIGTSLCQLGRLEFLNLQSNTISGAIPHDCWVNTNFLYTINLSFNKLAGVIPMVVGRLSQLAFLNLNSNSLEGPIPPTLNFCKRLEILDLGENKLSGKVPSFGVKSHPYLQILRLRANQLGGAIPLKLCSLPRLQILDLARNNLTGGIPHCFGQLKSMGMLAPTSPPPSTDAPGPPPFMPYPQGENAMEVLKGEELQCTTTLKFVQNLDLSCNALVGSIPEELTNLSGLIGLNLSYNHLTGKIPMKIGQMRSLESLDLSNNNLSGTIPASMSALLFLSHLNLSHNKLHGKIPTGQQLQTLDDPSIYASNLGLCGYPLPNKCTKDQSEEQGQGQEQEQEEEDDREKIFFYLVVALGFGTGFWGVVGTLFLKKQWRYVLFQLVENIIDYIYVQVALMINRMRK